jgi:hypothetical protein
MNKFEINVSLTWSKIMAFLILTMGFTLSVIEKDITTFTLAAPIAAATIGFKQHNDKTKVEKENGKTNE